MKLVNKIYQKNYIYKEFFIFQKIVKNNQNFVIHEAKN